MMRFKTVQSDGCWMVYDTQKGQVCLSTRSGNQPEAEQWTDVFNSAYAAFQDETRSPRHDVCGLRAKLFRQLLLCGAPRDDSAKRSST